MQRGVLIRRYKRFLADIESASGKALTIHCPNTGAMLGCADPGSTVWYSTSANPRRKYRHTLELVGNAAGELIAVNSVRANAVVAQALTAGCLPLLPRGGVLRREVAIPGARGRFDLCADGVFLEVKAVTLKLADSGAFPDAPSVRATRHVEALARLARQGRRSALVFCVMHTGIDAVRPADEIDPAYGAALRQAAREGVGVFALGCRISPSAIEPTEPLPVSLDKAV